MYSYLYFLNLNKIHVTSKGPIMKIHEKPNHFQYLNSHACFRLSFKFNKIIFLKLLKIIFEQDGILIIVFDLF